MEQNSKVKILIVDDSEMVRNYVHLVKQTDPEKVVKTIKILLKG